MSTISVDRWQGRRHADNGRNKTAEDEKTQFKIRERLTSREKERERLNKKDSEQDETKKKKIRRRWNKRVAFRSINTDTALRADQLTSFYFLFENFSVLYFRWFFILDETIGYVCLSIVWMSVVECRFLISIHTAVDNEYRRVNKQEKPIATSCWHSIGHRSAHHHRNVNEWNCDDASALRRDTTTTKTKTLLQTAEKRTQRRSNELDPTWLQKTLSLSYFLTVSLSLSVLVYSPMSERIERLLSWLSYHFESLTRIVSV